MSVPLPRSRALWLVLALVFALVGAVAPNAMAHERGSLYTQTNDPAGNTVQKFDRAADGSLTPAGTFATGGAGLAGLGGRQGAVELSEDGRTLYAVNAGSDSVSAFRAGHRAPKLLGSVPRAASRRSASMSTAAASTSSTPAPRRPCPPIGDASTAR